MRPSVKKVDRPLTAATSYLLKSCFLTIYTALSIWPEQRERRASSNPSPCRAGRHERTGRHERAGRAAGSQRSRAPVTPRVGPCSPRRECLACPLAASPLCWVPRYVTGELSSGTTCWQLIPPRVRPEFCHALLTCGGHPDRADAWGHLVEGVW